MEKEETTGRQGQRPVGGGWTAPTNQLFQSKNTMSRLFYFAVLSLANGRENSSQEAVWTTPSGSGNR